MSGPVLYYTSMFPTTNFFPVSHIRRPTTQSDPSSLIIVWPTTIISKEKSRVQSPVTTKKREKGKIVNCGKHRHTAVRGEGRSPEIDR